MIYSTLTTLKTKNPDLGNLKILLAEDNEVNLLLIKGILRYWGMEAKIAVNGFEVVELLVKEDFDVVLMDIQMPGKSGIEAAGEIRKLKDPKKKNVPIIALTANALKGEERKYQSVGMDDFLTKPFKEADLYEVIERVLRKEGSFERPYASLKSVEPEEVGIKLYDYNQFEDIAAESEDFLISLSTIYIKTIPSVSKDMVAATEVEDWDKVSKLAHKLKATIDNMNMVSVKKDIRTLETNSKNRINVSSLHQVAVKVDKVIGAVSTQLQQDFNLYD